MSPSNLCRRLAAIAILALLGAAQTHAQPPATPAEATTVTTVVPDGKPHKFEARDHQFWIDGQPTMLLAGEMHFGRVMADDWETRILQAKAMGLNAISFYLFWNQCEPRQGQFAFTGANDVRRVLELCQKHGMWAILRPGPYCCAETEFGGLPYWVIKDPSVQIRSADPQFLAYCRDYINAVGKQVADLQVSRGGPLVMVQIENEVSGAGMRDNTYMNALEKIFREAGLDGQLFTCNPTNGQEWTNPDFRMPGVLHGRNGLRNDAMFRQSADAIGDFPVFVPEMYTSWFSGWGEAIARQNGSLMDIIDRVDYLCDHHYSFSLYMFFGGTNFGFSNGSHAARPVQTSYDYRAPIDEAGRITPKYRALRALLKMRLNIDPPEPPADPPVIEIPPIALDQIEPLRATLPAKPTRTAEQPDTMEDLDQPYGFVLYRKTFPEGIHGMLELRGARDYTIAMLDGKVVGRAFRGFGAESKTMELNADGPATLDLLVYNLGRTSSPTSRGTQWFDHKGLTDGAWLDGEELTGWQEYSLPMDNADAFKASVKPATIAADGPLLYRGTFKLDEVGGSFLDMRPWGFGVVWVNGHNLGRYWDRGGLRSLFVPRQWLNKGENTITVLELKKEPANPEISGGTDIIEMTANPFEVDLDQKVTP